MKYGFHYLGADSETNKWWKQEAEVSDSGREGKSKITQEPVNTRAGGPAD